MNELYFVGMDVLEETKVLTDFTTSICTTGMTENELRAYNMGVSNALSALKEVLSSAESAFVVNVNDIEIQEEFDITDLEHYLLSL